jgi:hypothetical protein
MTLDVLHNNDFLGTLGAGWDTPVSHRVDGFVGNPTSAIIAQGGGAWSGAENLGTLFHVERATVEWIP